MSANFIQKHDKKDIIQLLLYNACYNNIKLLDKILKLSNIDVNIIDESECTMLHDACMLNHIEVVKLLLLQPY